MRKLLHLIVGAVISLSLLLLISSTASAEPSSAPSQVPQTSSEVTPPPGTKSPQSSTDNPRPSIAKKANQPSKSGVKAADKQCKGYKLIKTQALDRNGATLKFTKYIYGWDRGYVKKTKKYTYFCNAVIRSNHTASKGKGFFMKSTIFSNIEVVKIGGAHYKNTRTSKVLVQKVRYSRAHKRFHMDSCVAYKSIWHHKRWSASSMQYCNDEILYRR